MRGGHETFLAEDLGVLLAGHDQQVVARFRQPGESDHLDRRGRPGLLDRFAQVVEERLHLARKVAADERVARFERAHLHDHRRGRPAPGFELRFDDGAARRSRGRGLQFEQFGLERHQFEQMVDAGALGRGNLANRRVAAPIVGREALSLELLLDAVDVRAGHVDLVDRHHDADLGGLGMVDGFERLRHDAVVGSDDDDRNIRDVRAACAHRRKGRVAGRVEESDLAAVVRDAVRADVLGDAAGLALGDARLADGVHQRGLAVVDVTHENDDRRAGLEFFLGVDDHRRDRGLHDGFHLVHATALFAAFDFQHEPVLFA